MYGDLWRNKERKRQLRFCCREQSTIYLDCPERACGHNTADTTSKWCPLPSLMVIKQETSKICRVLSQSCGHFLYLKVFLIHPDNRSVLKLWSGFKYNSADVCEQKKWRALRVRESVHCPVREGNSRPTLFGKVDGHFTTKWFYLTGTSLFIAGSTCKWLSMWRGQNTAVLQSSLPRWSLNSQS